MNIEQAIFMNLNTYLRRDDVHFGVGVKQFYTDRQDPEHT